MKQEQRNEAWHDELLRLKDAVGLSAGLREKIPGGVGALAVNPSLQVLQLSWRNLIPLLQGRGGESSSPPGEGEEIVLVWFDPSGEEMRVEQAAEEDLAALKVVVEGIDPLEAAAAAGRPVGVVDVAIQSAVRKGLLLSPPSRIRRDPGAWPASSKMDEKHLVSRGFTLQWHITQACDLHCRHCYDRTSRKMIPFDRALGILDDLREFCRRRFVTGHVSFTGGNPLMHPNFYELYQAASDRGFTMSVLGNPASREEIERIVAIEKPYVYQVSLEGLEEHSDSIRGEGHYRSVMEFLPLLKELGVDSTVMLTLTEGNMDQILPLADRLEGVAGSFFFNRLAAFGEGAALRLPDSGRYEAFLEKFVERAGQSDLIGLKDNLINILRLRKGDPLFGGCTGFGCGAAFNFITLLSEGEAHACRKLPSPIGNVLEEGLEGVYGSEEARRYRAGCSACRECEIRPLCGGCLAVSSSLGLDPFTEKDPQCFIGDGTSRTASSRESRE